MLRTRRLLQAKAHAVTTSITTHGSHSAARRCLSHRALVPPLASSSAPPIARPVSRFLHPGTNGLTPSGHVRYTPAIIGSRRFRSVLTTAEDDQRQRYLSELAAFGENGNWRQALKLLDRIDKSGFALDPAMYELAMVACARMGKIEVLPGLLENMEVDSLLPTNRTVDVVMQAYIAAEEWRLIVGLARDMTGKGVVLSDAAFQAAFEACGKMQDAESVRRIFINIERTGSHQLTTELYASGIRACGMAGRADVAARLFAHMEKTGLTADADAYNQLIRSQIVNTQLPQALQTFAVVNDREVLLPESIYTATIDALVTQGEFWHAHQLFSQMLEHGLSPSVFCLGRMMVAFIRLNRHPQARECWEQIITINEPSPNATKYAKMVDQLSATNDSELAIRVFEHIFPRFDPSAIRDTTYAAAIRSYGRVGRTTTALDLFDTFVTSRRRQNKPLPRFAGIYVAVFNALSRDTTREPKENTRDALRVWELMTENVPVIMPPAYASLAGVLAASGDLDALNELLGHVEEAFPGVDGGEPQARSRRPKAPANSYQHGTGRGFMSAEDGLKLDEMVLDDDEVDRVGAPSSGPRGSDNSWSDSLLFNGVISGFSKARDDQTHRVVEYLDMMKSRGLPINDSVLRAATDSFVRHQQWNRIIELWKYVDTGALSNPDVAVGDTISKLLEAEAWEAARVWISRAHHLGLQPPIRGKMEILAKLRGAESSDWQIAYALARETLSFKQMVQENVESVADAIEVCLNANRSDLAIKLFERTALHTSLNRPLSDLRIPLRMYKTTLLSCMREHMTSEAGRTMISIEKAENICTQMLQLYRKDGLDAEALSMAISIKATTGADGDIVALFEKMQEHGFEPNSYAFKAAIVAYSRSNQIDQVIAIRDALVEQGNHAILEEPKVIQSLLFSIAILTDAAKQEVLLADTLTKLPHITSENVVHAFMQAKRYDTCVEFFDAAISKSMFSSLLRRIVDGNQSDPSGVDLSLAAQLMLKYIAFHGLDKLQPPTLILKITKLLIQDGKLTECRAILDLFTNPSSELTLSDMKYSFQREVLEMLLFINGEERNYDGLCGLFEQANPSSFPLGLRYYQLAMEYACPSAVIGAVAKAKQPTKLTATQEEAGALACLKLFENLRLHFVKPNGPVYLLALQSCYRLGRLEVTGARVIQDAQSQDFGRVVTTELFRMANIAVHERRASTLDGFSAASDDGMPIQARPRGRPSKKVVPSPPRYQVDVDELVAIALMCHHKGVEVSGKLAAKLLELGTLVPLNARNELEYIVSNSPSTPTRSASKVTARRDSRHPQKPKKYPSSPRSSRPGQAGARWGDYYSQKHSSDE